ncbi:type IV-A pilus assembly ATPase PilB, partial [Francisella tularensis]|nr:type IV-A pilus assembly ATPase PilB [Francisella tularensis]
MIENPHICKKLASLLLHRKLITKQQLEEISHDKSLAKQDFLEYLIENEIVDNKSFMIESATLLRLQYIDLTTINVKFLPQEYFDIDFCRENHCLVLFTRKRTIHVAIANPIESQQILKKLRSRYDCAFIPVVA